MRTRPVNPFRSRRPADPSPRRRRAVARGIERLLEHGRRPGLPARPLLVRPSVVAATEPALEQIAAALRDEQRATPDGWAAAVEAFITDGATSPLYGVDPAAARAEAERLAAAA
jgi:hypothetical protein